MKIEKVKTVVWKTIAITGGVLLMPIVGYVKAIGETFEFVEEVIKA